MKRKQIGKPEKLANLQNFHRLGSYLNAELFFTYSDGLCSVWPKQKVRFRSGVLHTHVYCQV